MGPHYAELFRTFLLFLTGMPVFLAYSYLNLYFIIPKLLGRKKYGLLFLCFLITGFIFSILLILITNNIFARFFQPEDFILSNVINYKSISYNYVLINLPFLMFGSAKMLNDFFSELQLKNEIELKNTQAELSLLSTQLHPHFLFNTLNNLYSLSVTGSPKTAASIQKVNGLMRYILFECGKAEVCIRNEINLIENYIELEKLRYDKRLKINITDKIQNLELLIAPLILFTFVENCFKHGSSKTPGKSFIRISIATRGRDLFFESENSIHIQKASTIPDHAGLGLENVRKRLQFLYSGRHELIISQDEKKFKVDLRIYNMNLLNQSYENKMPGS
jgi:sensor histidine kinase YesM